MTGVSQEEPPRNLLGRLRHAGPGIIISGSIVGSGELVVTTKLGAEVGFVFLWLILFSCIIKVFIQIELGRHVVASGATVLEALDRIPGPRIAPGVSWLNGLWAVMFVGSVLQLGGVLTALVGVFALESLALHDVPPAVWPAGIAGVTAILLASGRYRLVELSTTALVVLFTFSTVTAVVWLQSTDSAIRAAELGSGLLPRVPETRTVTAFAVLGITGVGAAELIYYPYWCLEKGYARAAGPPDGSAEWLARARGWVGVMQVDAWLSCAVYTVGTVAFYLLGAATLHRRGVVPGEADLHPALASMYTASLGPDAGSWMYVLGATAVLFSTFFVATASNGRVLVDAVHVFRIRRFEGPEARLRAIRFCCVGIAAFCWAVCTFVGTPVTLILIGGVAQAALLPFLAVAVAWLRYRRTPRALAPFSAMDPFLWLAVLATFAIGIQQLGTHLGWWRG